MFRKISGERHLRKSNVSEVLQKDKQMEYVRRRDPQRRWLPMKHISNSTTIRELL